VILIGYIYKWQTKVSDKWTTTDVELYNCRTIGHYQLKSGVVQSATVGHIDISQTELVTVRYGRHVCLGGQTNARHLSTAWNTTPQHLTRVTTIRLLQVNATKPLPGSLNKYKCTMNQQLFIELLAGSRRTLLHMQQGAGGGRCCTCTVTHQIAALFWMKWRHGRHLESVTSGLKPDSVSGREFNYREQSCQISSRSDLKRRNLSPNSNNMSYMTSLWCCQPTDIVHVTNLHIPAICDQLLIQESCNWWRN